MFGKRLRQLRMKRGHTQQSMADQLNIALRTYQGYEGGTRSPSFDLLVSIADLLDVSIDYLFGRDEFLASLGVSVDGYEIYSPGHPK